MRNGATYDVVIVGGGLTGLATAVRLAALGCRVAIVERGDAFGEGSSTKNEGWLHAGTFHATSILDPAEAVAVARRCIYGHRTIASYMPGCVEDDGEALAIVPEHLLDHALARWDASDVRFSPVRRTHLETLRGDVHLQPGERVFSVADLGIDTRLLVARYLNDLRIQGGDTYRTSEPLSWSGSELTVRHRGGLAKLRCRQLIIAAGFGCERVLAQLGLPGPAFRYWRSHLCITPRLSRHAVFSIASGEPAMMTHGARSITGLNQDAGRVPTPSFEPTDEGIRVLGDAMRSRFRHFDETGSSFTACTKLDVTFREDSERSLNVCVAWLGENVLLALPGKMTETPYVSDEVVRKVFDSVAPTLSVARRPMDDMPVSPADAGASGRTTTQEMAP